MVKIVQEDPFIPIAWQKDHKGMQGTEYFTQDDSFTNGFASAIEDLRNRWLCARDKAVESAIELYDHDITKQLCNRLLEPFMWHTVLLTGTEFENFFELRCPSYEHPYKGKRFKSKKEFIEYDKWVLETTNDTNLGYNAEIEDHWRIINKGQAEIHMQALAEAMWDEYNESIPKELKEGEWHIPFGDKIDESKIRLLHYGSIQSTTNVESLYNDSKIKIATARCSRLSYMTFDGEIDYEKDLKLHDTLLESRHMSPFEHCARAMSEEEYGYLYKSVGPNPEHFEIGWCNNYRGFIQYRYLIENYYDGFRM